MHLKLFDFKKEEKNRRKGKQLGLRIMQGRYGKKLKKNKLYKAQVVELNLKDLGATAFSCSIKRYHHLL